MLLELVLSGEKNMYVATEEIYFLELDANCLLWLDAVSMYVGKWAGHRFSFSQYLLLH